MTKSLGEMNLGFVVSIVIVSMSLLSLSYVFSN